MVGFCARLQDRDYQLGFGIGHGLGLCQIIYQVTCGSGPLWTTLGAMKSRFRASDPMLATAVAARRPGSRLISCQVSSQPTSEQLKTS